MLSSTVKIKAVKRKSHNPRNLCLASPCCLWRFCHNQSSLPYQHLSCLDKELFGCLLVIPTWPHKAAQSPGALTPEQCGHWPRWRQKALLRLQHRSFACPRAPPAAAAEQWAQCWAVVFSSEVVLESTGADISRQKSFVMSWGVPEMHRRVYALVKYERGYVQTWARCEKTIAFGNRWPRERFIKPPPALRRELEMHLLCLDGKKIHGPSRVGLQLLGRGLSPTCTY